MSYSYHKQKQEYVLTDQGQKDFLAVRDKVKLMIKASGAFLMLMALGYPTDDWNCMSCVDRMLELGEIIEVERGPGCPGQYRIFTSKGT